MTQGNKIQLAGSRPSVLVFDVNETLIDFEAMYRLFEHVFGDKRVVREWLSQLFLYSMTISLSGLYEDYWAIGSGCFEMVGTIHDVKIKPADTEELKQIMKTMPAHKDAENGLKMLLDAGFRMVTLTNSPSTPGGRSPIDHAGLAGYFERQFSIETVQVYKPASTVYQMVAHDLGVPLSSCCMIACHAWDIVGAQSAGMTGALITRPGNAPLPIPGLPQPHLLAPDLPRLAAKIIEQWRS